jgi:hypothetical protein
MRTLLFIALFAAVFTASASAGHSNGTGPKNDLATGSGKFATLPPPGGFLPFTAMHFSYSAHMTESGIHGNVNYHAVNTGTGEELNGKGPVVCFDVRDNRARIIFEFKDVRPFGERFQFGQLIVEDNGQPSDTSPDRAIAEALGGGEGGELPPTEPPAQCPVTSDVFMLPVDSGNVSVHDGTE